MKRFFTIFKRLFFKGLTFSLFFATINIFLGCVVNAIIINKDSLKFYSYPKSQLRNEYKDSFFYISNTTDTFEEEMKNKYKHIKDIFKYDEDFINSNIEYEKIFKMGRLNNYNSIYSYLIHNNYKNINHIIHYEPNLPNYSYVHDSYYNFTIYKNDKIFNNIFIVSKQIFNFFKIKDSDKLLNDDCYIIDLDNKYVDSNISTIYFKDLCDNEDKPYFEPFEVKNVKTVHIGIENFNFITGLTNHFKVKQILVLDNNKFQEKILANGGTYTREFLASNHSTQLLLKHTRFYFQNPNITLNKLREDIFAPDLNYINSLETNVKDKILNYLDEYSKYVYGDIDNYEHVFFIESEEKRLLMYTGNIQSHFIFVSLFSFVALILLLYKFRVSNNNLKTFSIYLLTGCNKSELINVFIFKDFIMYLISLITTGLIIFFTQGKTIKLIVIPIAGGKFEYFIFSAILITILYGIYLFIRYNNIKNIDINQNLREES